MNYLIAVFKSRNETLNFSNYLKSSRITNSIINTPKEASAACGISVKFFPEYYSRVWELLRTRRFSSFAGIFRVSNYNGRLVVEKLD